MIVKHDDKKHRAHTIVMAMTTAQCALQNCKSCRKKIDCNTAASLFGIKKNLVFNKPTWGTAVSYWIINGGHE